jgi:hypothetical protein
VLISGDRALGEIGDSGETAVAQSFGASPTLSNGISEGKESSSGATADDGLSTIF